MAILLDTHAFVWWVLDDSKLSRRASAAIDADAETYLSGVVAWEIATKVRVGRWPDAQPVHERLLEIITASRFKRLPITVEHAHLAGSLQVEHGDPFDRMLAAQAIIERASLVTVDRAFEKFEVDVLW